MADDLVGLRPDETPARVRRHDEPSDEVVVATEQTRGRRHVLFGEYRVGKRHGIPGVRLSLDVLEHLAALRIDAEGARRVEALSLEEAKERVDRRRPRAGAATDGVADPDRVVQISAERAFLGHRGRG